PETRNPKPETRNPKPETRNPKPETRNLKPKPETRNPKPETRNPKPSMQAVSAEHFTYGDGLKTVTGENLNRLWTVRVPSQAKVNYFRAGPKDFQFF
ncbi:hypothetical protein T484DRAFT_1607829, partial [Baffinella frigidus]